MIKVRLKRLGAKFQPFYRIVVADARVQRDGKYIEQVGTYNPKTGDLNISKETALKWLKEGAKPTTTVKRLFSHEGIMTEFANSKTKGKKQEVKSKTGLAFGKEHDPNKNYTEPGTKPADKSAKKIQAEAAAEAAKAKEEAEAMAKHAQAKEQTADANAQKDANKKAQDEAQHQEAAEKINKSQGTTDETEKSPETPNKENVS